MRWTSPPVTETGVRGFESRLIHKYTIAIALVAKLADAADLKSAALKGRTGSSPVRRTMGREAQWAEHPAHNRKEEGSNPFRPTQNLVA